MDEISIVNILNNIKDKVPAFHWNLTCKYDNGKGVMVMEVAFYDPRTNGNYGKLLYQNETGAIVNGWYKALTKFEQGTNVMDAILDIMNYETDEQ